MALRECEYTKLKGKIPIYIAWNTIRIHIVIEVVRKISESKEAMLITIRITIHKAEATQSKYCQRNQIIVLEIVNECGWMLPTN